MKLSPKHARTNVEVCALNRDNTSVGDYWMLSSDTDVKLAEQPEGENPKGMVTIPREVFIRLINWYQRPQKISRSKP